MILSLLKNKIFLSSVIGIVLVIFGVLFWWYQDLFSRDSLLMYIPSETVFYSHLQTDSKIPSDALDGYFGVLENFLNEERGNFQEEYLPYVSEVSFFVFIDPVEKIPSRGIILRSDESREYLRVKLKNTSLSQKEFRGGVFVILDNENFLSSVKWKHHRKLSTRLREISKGKAFSFFVQREEFVQYLEKNSVSSFEEIFVSYVSRWEPFLFGALGENNGFLTFRLSDFSERYRKSRFPIKIKPLENFSLLYETNRPHEIFEEIGLSFDGIQIKDGTFGVALSPQEDGGITPLFFFELIAENEEVLKKDLKKILGKFIPVRRVFVLPDGEKGYEIVYDAEAFSLEGNQVLLDGKPYPFFIQYQSVGHNIFRVFFSSKQKLISGGITLASQTDTTMMPIGCIQGSPKEFLEFRKEILPQALQVFFPGESYLIARTSQTGFSLEGCEL